MRRVAAAGDKIWAWGGKNRKTPSSTLFGSHASTEVGRAVILFSAPRLRLSSGKPFFFALFKLLGDISDLSSVQILTVIAGA